MEKVKEFFVFIITWVSAAFIFLMGLAFFMGNWSEASGWCLLLASFFLFPPIRDVIYKVTNRKMTFGGRMTAVIVLLMLAVVVMEDRPTPQRTNVAESAPETVQAASVVEGQGHQEETVSFAMPKSVKEARKMEKHSSPTAYKLLGDLYFGTDAQKDEAKKGAKGRSIQWIGLVNNVKKKTFGGYKVDVFIGEHPLSLTAEFNIDKKFALELSRGEEVFFVGEIQDIDTLLGTSVQLENVKLISLRDIP